MTEKLSQQVQDTIAVADGLSKDMAEKQDEIIAMTRLIWRSIPDDTDGAVAVGAIIQVALNMAKQMGEAHMQEGDDPDYVMGVMSGAIARNIAKLGFKNNRVTASKEH